MSNRIVVLGTYLNPAGDGSFTVSGVFWLTVPASNVVPYPQLQSQVPFIDQNTLSQLRLGTLLEQSFTTGYFLSGTTLASIQTALQTQFTTAQTALTNNASPLAGLVGTEYTGSAWVSVASGLVVFDPARNVLVNFREAAGSGVLPGVKVGRAIGYCSTSATTTVPIMSTTYTPPGANAQRSVVSTSANDSASGTGARSVTINYLDASMALHQETITLNGTTAVNTVGTNWAFMEGSFLSAVGSGGTNAGTINFWTGTGGTGSIWASIAIDGSNQTNYCHHYVPTGVTCYISTCIGGSFATVGTCYLLHTGSPLTANLPMLPAGPTLMHAAGVPTSWTFRSPVAVPGPDRIIMYVKPQAATADATLGNFEYFEY